MGIPRCDVFWGGGGARGEGGTGQRALKVGDPS